MARDARISLPVLLRGEVAPVSEAFMRSGTAQARVAFAQIVIGAGLYGAAMGMWRSPMQSLFVAVKFPLIILLTTAGNALLNAMLAPLLGLRVSVRQSLSMILGSFTIVAIVLGAFSPLAAFMVYNAPPLSSDVRQADVAYSSIQLMHVGVIAFAGCAGNARLFQVLRHLSSSPLVAWRVLLAWLSVNFLLGSQVSWILRPFIGSPSLPVQFFRAEALRGNFYETVFNAFLHLLPH